MGAAVIRGIVNKRVAWPEVGVELLHDRAHHVRSGEHVYREAFCSGEKTIVGGDDAAGEITCRVEHT
jgi:hypothetical protein